MLYTHFSRTSVSLIFGTSKSVNEHMSSIHYVMLPTAITFSISLKKDDPAFPVDSASIPQARGTFEAGRHNSLRHQIRHHSSVDAKQSEIPQAYAAAYKCMRQH